MPDTISVRLVNTSSATNWNISLCAGADTIYSGTIIDSLRFNLSASGDYSLACSRADTSVSMRFFIRRDYNSSPDIDITCSNYNVLSSSATLNDIGRLYAQFAQSSYQSIHNFQPSRLNEEFALLKQKVLRLRDDIGRLTVDSSTPSPSLNKAFLPITQYIDNVAARWSALKNLPGKMMMSQGQLISRLLAMPSLDAINEDRLVIESTESLFLFSRVSYAVALSASHWFEIEFPGIVERGKMSVDLARLIRLLVGSRSTCEIAYGLFQRSSTDRGLNYVTCDEPLPTYILELALSDNGKFCKNAVHDLRAVCEGLSITELKAFSAVDPAGKGVTYHLDPDSVYVLHFWGTWCAPCLQQEKSILLVGDTLATMGFRMLHLATEISRNRSIWQQHIAFFPKHQYFIAHDSTNSVITSLAVNTFPSYLVIGRGNRILKRIDDYWHLTKFVSTVHEQK